MNLFILPNSVGVIEWAEMVRVGDRGAALPTVSCDVTDGRLAAAAIFSGRPWVLSEGSDEDFLFGFEGPGLGASTSLGCSGRLGDGLVLEGSWRTNSRWLWLSTTVLKFKYTYVTSVFLRVELVAFGFMMIAYKMRY